MFPSFLKFLGNLVFTPISLIVTLGRLFVPRSDSLCHLPGHHGVMGNLRSLFDMLRFNTLDFLLQLKEKYGTDDRSPIAFRFLGRPAVFISDPEHIYQVFNDREHFSLSSPEFLLSSFRRELPDNLITVSEHEWLPMRIRTNYMLNGLPLKRIVKLMRETMEQRTLPEWREYARKGESFDLGKSVFVYSSIVACRFILGVSQDEIPDTIHDQLSRMFNHVRKRTLSPIVIPSWIPTSSNRSYVRDTTDIKNYILQYLDRAKTTHTLAGSIIRARTQRNYDVTDDQWDQMTTYIQRSIDSPTATPDEINRILRQKYEKIKQEGEDKLSQIHYVVTELRKAITNQYKLKESVEEDEVECELGSILCQGGTIDVPRAVNEIRGMLIGASETTILLMQWILIHISENLEIQDKIYESIKDEKSDVPTYDPTRHKYLYGVLREGLRLGPPAFVFIRYAVKDVYMNKGEFFIPKDTTVVGSQYITHRLKDVWENETKFDPDRWNKPAQRGSFFPFTGGPRMCPGQNFAINEAFIAIATLFKHFKFRRDDNRKVGYNVGLTLRPDTSIRIVLEPRDSPPKT